MRLHGRWGATDIGARRRWRSLSTELAAAPPQAQLGWDLSGLDWLDHVGAQLLWNHWGRAWPQRVVLDTTQRSLLERVASLTTRHRRPSPGRWASRSTRWECWYCMRSIICSAW
jgi:phospholipid/cholesterol/gamma-HCH transport system permease protein